MKHLNSIIPSFRFKKLAFAAIIQSFIIFLSFLIISEYVSKEKEAEYLLVAKSNFRDFKSLMAQEVYINSVIKESPIDKLPSVNSYRKAMLRAGVNVQIVSVKCSLDNFFFLEVPSIEGGVCFKLHFNDGFKESFDKLIIPVLGFIFLISFPIYYFLIRSVAVEEELLIKAEFLEEVRHNLNSPLLVLKSIAQQSDFINSQNKEHFENNILLIEKYIQLNKAEKPSSRIEDYFVPAVLIHKILNQKELEFANLKNKVSFEVFDNSCGAVIFFNRLEFSFIISNLINNSVAVVRGNGAIQVFLQLNTDSLSIIVSDNGLGISPANLKKIFTRGFTTKGDKGSGLGLYHAKQILESYKGKITVESNEGKGTQVKLNFICAPQKSEVFILEDDKYLSLSMKKNIDCDLMLEGIRVGFYQNIKDFITSIQKADKNSIIIIDSKIGEESEAGISIIPFLSKKGYKELFIHSSFDATKFKDISGIKGIINKNNIEIYQFLRALNGIS